MAEGWDWGGLRLGNKQFSGLAPFSSHKHFPSCPLSLPSHHLPVWNLWTGARRSYQLSGRGAGAGKGNKGWGSSSSNCWLWGAEKAEGDSGDRNGKQENTCVTLAGSGEGPGNELELGLPVQTLRTSSAACLQAPSPLRASVLPPTRLSPWTTWLFYIYSVLKFSQWPRVLSWCPLHACMLSGFRLFVTPWTVVHQAPLSIRFSRQVNWRGLPCPPPGDFPEPGIKPMSPTSPASQDSLSLSHQGSPLMPFTTPLAPHSIPCSTPTHILSLVLWRAQDPWLGH